MWAALIGSLAVAAPSSIAVDDPTPLIVVSTSPAKVETGLPATAVYETVAAALGPHSPLAVRTPEQAGIDVATFVACPLDRRFACWTRLASADDRSAILLVVSLVPGAGVGGVALDLEAANEALEALGSASSERAENRLFSIAVSLTATGDDPIEERLGRAVKQALTKITRRRGLARTGKIELSADAGLHIYVDGRAVGITRDSPTSLESLRPGRRQVELRAERDAEAVAAGAVDVASEATAVVDLRPTERPSHPMHAYSAWAGAGVAAAGAALVFAALATQPEDRVLMPDAERSVDYDGVLAPIGFGLIGAGAVAGVGYGWFANAETYEWWWAAIGVAAGALVFGANLAVDAITP